MIEIKNKITDKTMYTYHGDTLIGAKLSKVNLTGANLSGADLSRANLTEATLPIIIE